MAREAAGSGVMVVIVLTGVGLLAAIGKWLELPPSQRLVQLQHLVQVERLASLPPLLVHEQARWLVQQRSQHLLHMTSLLGAAGLIGLVEGWCWRQQCPWGGLSVWRWRLGGVTLGLAMASAAAYLLVPWPLLPMGVSIVLALLGGMGMYWMAAGRPLLP